MSANEHSKRLAWQDRWSKPTMPDLLSHLSAQHRNIFKDIVKQVEAFGDIETSIVWYGVAWKWTIQCHWTGAKDPNPFCFLIPKQESPEICIPLATDMITELPMRRLNRSIRDGIRVAKCALEVHWATWSPSNQSEVGHILDLLKRKHRFLTGDTGKSKAKATETDDDEAKPVKKAATTKEAKSSKTKSTAKSKSKRSTKRTTASRKSGSATTKKTTKSKSTKRSTKAASKRTTKRKTSRSSKS